MTVPVQLAKNLWNAIKAVIRRKFITISAHTRKIEQVKINNAVRNLKILEKQEEAGHKLKLWREIIKISAVAFNSNRVLSQTENLGWSHQVSPGSFAQSKDLLLKVCTPALTSLRNLSSAGSRAFLQ